MVVGVSSTFCVCTWSFCKEPTFYIYILHLLQQLNSIKYSWADSPMRSFEQADVSEIAFLIIRFRLRTRTIEIELISELLVYLDDLMQLLT
jgi:hypothetical protein